MRLFSLDWFNKFFRASYDVVANDIDWKMGETFHKSITADTTFTFSNIKDGKSISIHILNTSGATVNIVFPTGLWKDSSIDLAVEAGKLNVYSLIHSNGKTAISGVTKLSNV